MDLYSKQWEKALKDGVFKEKSRPVQKYDEDDDIDGINDIDAKYWNRVWDMTNDIGDAPDPLDAFDDSIENEDDEDEEEGHDPSMTGDENVVIQEEEEEGWEDTQGVKVSKYNDKFAKETEYSPNPIYRDSRGKDQRPHVTPNWTWGVELAELTEMKVQLEKLESKMNAADAFAKSKEAGKVKRQIDELWEKIDSLSNKLNPDFLKGYMS